MLNLRFALGIFLIGVMVLSAAVVSGQDYPNKPIHIVAGTAGGGSDFDARQIAQGISGSLGQPVVVDNRGNAIVIGEIVSKAPPDGYTLLLIGTGLWILPLLQKAPYDMSDFAPVSLIERTVNILVVHPSLPVQSVKELIDLAKAKPGELNYASVSIGGPAHLAAELFKSMASVNIVHVPFKGAAPANTALIGGEVQLTFADVGLLAPLVKAGRLRALAVTSADPSVLAPGLPTVASAGLPGYELVGLNGVFAPGKTPDAIINRLNQEIVRFLNRAEVKERFLNAGIEIIASSPAQFAVTMKSDIARISKVIKDAGIKIN